jgi:hypothetical protein
LKTSSSFTFKIKGMKHIVKTATILYLTALASLASCKESTTVTTEEKTEITKMDSTSTVVKKSTSKLDDQTKKLEESIEKLDKEFTSEK